MQFGGGGTSTFTAAPSSGSPTLPIGTGPFTGGAAPAFQGTSAVGINMASGYTGLLFAGEVAGVTQFYVNYDGRLGVGGNFGGLSVIYGLTGGLAINPDSHGGDIFLGDGVGHAIGRFSPTAGTTITNWSAVGITALTVQGMALQTGDLLRAQDSVPVNQFGIANVGTGAAPIWAMRVAPVANTASMAQAHVGGASTGKAIQVIDNAGTTIGWLQLLA